MALIEAKVEVPHISDREVTPRPPCAISVKNVLFATDFSATSEAALPYAAAICRHFGGTLHAVHVLSDAGILMMSGGVDYVSMGTIYEDAHTEAKEKLDDISLRLHGIAFHSHVRHGQVWKNLAILVEANKIDLIVLGTHGRTGLGKLLLGSVAEDILRHAPCPVLTIGPKVSGHARLPVFPPAHGRDVAPLELELQEIVFATDFAQNAERVATEAVRLAEEFRSRLTLVHVIEDYAHLGQHPGPIEEGVRRLRALVPPDAALQYPADTVLEFGSVPERILKVAAEREADMIVLGARSAADTGGTHIPWSSAHHVIAQALCPVLTIRE